ncbi:MAG: hypothetical protein JNL32_00035 [Candidatus Kapabacteria bacterium]|nr:hypothetical protein [Candidatus Kapabacteria bacterium]
MEFVVQKTIISKYLELVEQDHTTEAQISELLTTIDHLCKVRVLRESDIFRQKLEFIYDNLALHLSVVRRKRTVKKIKIELSEDIYQLFLSDTNGYDYQNNKIENISVIAKEEYNPITLDNVKNALLNILIYKRRLTSEKDVEKHIADKLAIIFGKENIHRQYSVGGFLALKTDIDVGNGQIGIEIKISDNLSATDMQRMIGQVVYYKKRFYDNNLLLYVVSKSVISPTLNELKTFVEELGVTVIFRTALH